MALKSKKEVNLPEDKPAKVYPKAKKISDFPDEFSIEVSSDSIVVKELSGLELIYDIPNDVNTKTFITKEGSDLEISQK